MNIVDETYRAHDSSGHPVIILNSDFNIAYKNSAAKFVNMTPRMGASIKKYIDCDDFKKLCFSIKNKSPSIIKLNIPAEISRCVINPTEKNIIELIFFDTLNCVDASEEMCRARLTQFEDIISKFTEDEFNHYKRVSNFLNFSVSLPEENVIVMENKRELRNFLRIKEHLKSDILNMPSSRKICKSYLDIGAFLNDFNKSISPCGMYSGYKVNFAIEDKMFLYSLVANDFAMINYLLSIFCIRCSILGTINACFYTYSNTGILRYEFRQKSGFGTINKKLSAGRYGGNSKEINNFDFIFIIMLLKNNNLKLTVDCDLTDSGTMRMDLIFNSKNR
jgi:hypothetical protein